MPLRSNAFLWYALPGVVAAWQPVRAPGPLLARYNMAHGGDNRYRATDGTAPTWHGALGWQFNGSSQYLATGVVTTRTWSYLVRFASASANLISLGVVDETGGTHYDFIRPRTTTNRQYYLGEAGVTVAGAQTSGVMGRAGVTCYLNGMADGTISSFNAPSALQHYIGALNFNGSAAQYHNGTILAQAFYSRTLSAADVWTASRQMAYCDVNPDWSVWSRRRQWFYRSTEIVASTIYRRRVPALIRTGTRGEML